MKQPHVLILDEPTNHLDYESITALIAGINSFRGGVVMVDKHWSIWFNWLWLGFT